jgi:hypothetical protein
MAGQESCLDRSNQHLQGDIPMRRVAIAIIATGIVAATSVHATQSNHTVLVPPADLPALARQSGDAMLLHQVSDGRTLLYIEQDQGTRLAAFDVTDPAHVKGESSVQLDAAGPFDFISPIGKQAELVRFRLGHEDAVLDLHKEKVPTFKSAQDLKRPETVDTDVKQVRQELTNAETGTTFLLTENGLFLIRRPAVESDQRQRDLEWFWQHNGG